MINFRYHVVSLIAVFFALTMGVIFGASVIDQTIVNVIRGRQEVQEKTIDGLRRDVNRLQDEADQYQLFVAGAQGELLRNRLAERPLVVLGFESTPGEVFDGVISTLRASGARLDGVFALSERLDLSSDVNRRDVGAAVDSTSEDPEVLRGALAERLGASLVGREPGFLNRLLEAGLGQLRPVDGVTFRPASELASVDGAVLMLAPGPDSRMMNAEALALPLADSISGAGGRLLIGEPGSEDLELLPPVRSNPALRISSVDGIERSIGQVSVVFALEGVFDGRFGHFGLGENATSPIPEIRPA